jgi:hypothetical protein
MIIDEPIEFEQGHKYGFTLMADIDAKYEISVECKEEIPRDEIRRLLGARYSMDIIDTLHIRWEVSQNGQIIASGNAANEMYNEIRSSQNIGRVLGSFEATSEKEYTVDIVMDESIGLLSGTYPRLRVGITPGIVKVYSLRAAAAFSVGKDLLILGLVLIGICGIIRCIRKRKNR